MNNGKMQNIRGLYDYNYGKSGMDSHSYIEQSNKRHVNEGILVLTS